jgi:hypothetical protein
LASELRISRHSNFSSFRQYRTLGLMRDIVFRLTLHSLYVCLRPHPLWVLHPVGSVDSIGGRPLAIASQVVSSSESRNAPPCPTPVPDEKLDWRCGADDTERSSNHNCCLIGGPRPFGSRAAPVNLVGAAGAESLQRRPRTKDMPSLLPAYFPRCVNAGGT